MKNMIEELKRRHVFKVGAAYCIAAWFLLQFADVVLPTFNTPPWVNQLLVIAIVLGFPVAIFTAWIYDLVPPGLVKTKPLDKQEIEDPGSDQVREESLQPNPALERIDVAEAVDKSIAILPLTNLSPVAENAYFCDGIHDEILNQLSKVSDIRVISRTATLQYRDTTESTRQIAQNLIVGLIMEGSVRYAGNRVRIHTQLVRARDDTQLWSEIYESELNDIFSIQSDVALKVASAMQARLMPDEIARIKRPATSNVEAYTLFLRAIARENQESFKITAEKDGWIEAGLRDLQLAVQLDPVFARGYAQLGWLQILKRYTVAFNIVESNQLLVEAKANAEKALSIDPSIVQAYSILAFVAFERHHWAEWEELDRKSAAFPDAKSGVLLNFAERLGRLGRFDEALDVIERSIALDPIRMHNREYIVYYKVLGRHYESALVASESYREAGGDQGAYHLYRALAYYFLGQTDNARSELKAIKGDLAGAHLNCPLFCAFLHSRLAGGEAARIYVEQQDSPVAKEFADFGGALGSGDFDHAFDNLERYMQGGQVVSDLGEILDEIRDDSRWQMVVDYLAAPRTVLQK